MPNPKPKRKQLNIGLSLEQYELVMAAAQAEEITVTEFCRDAILEASAPVDPEQEGPPIPSWLVALFLFLHRGKTEKPA